MGRMCAWCRAVFRGTSAPSRSVSHVLCDGCLADLRSALASTGMRIEEQPPRRRAGRGFSR